MFIFLFSSLTSTLVVYEETAGNKDYVKYNLSFNFNAELTLCLYMFLMLELAQPVGLYYCR